MNATDPEDVLWKVQFTDEGTTSSASLHRLNVYFIAEDPFVYASRVASAHELRRTVEKQIVRNIYADFMPMEDMKHLDSEQVSRITINASSSRVLKGAGIPTQSIIQEINMDYTRTMNCIVLEHKVNGGKVGEAGGAGKSMLFAKR